MRIVQSRTKLCHAGAIAALVVGVSVGLTALGTATPAAAQDKKPNILFIMGDDIGWMQVVSYQGGLGLGGTDIITEIVPIGPPISVECAGTVPLGQGFDGSH